MRITLLPKENAGKIRQMLEAYRKEEDLSFDVDNQIGSIEDGITQCVIAENGQLCGIGGYEVRGNDVYGLFFYVLPEHRKTGLASRIYCAGRKDWRLRGAKRMKFITRPENVSMYQRIGHDISFVVMEGRA